MRKQDLENIKEVASKLTKPEIDQWLEWIKYNQGDGTHLESRMQVKAVLLSL